MKKIFFIFALSLVWLPGLVLAQTETAANLVDDVAVTAEETAAVTADDTVQAPSAFGIWWQGVKETITLAVTFDPVKAAEKRLAYAQRRMEWAQALADSSDDPRVIAKAEAMVARAQKLTEKIQANQEKWMNDEDQEGVKKFLEKWAERQEKDQEIFDELEQRVPEYRVEKMQELRQEGLAGSQRLVNALANENIPEDVKVKLTEIQTKIEDHLEAVKALNEERRTLMQDIQTGDEEAREELKQLNEERREEIKNRLEERQDEDGGRVKIKQRVEQRLGETNSDDKIKTEDEDEDEDISTDSEDEDEDSVDEDEDEDSTEVEANSTTVNRRLNR